MECVYVKEGQDVQSLLRCEMIFSFDEWMSSFLLSIFAFLIYLLGCVLQIEQRLTAALQEQSQLVGLTWRRILFLLALLRRRRLIQHLLKDSRT